MKLIKSNFLVVSDYNWLSEPLEESWVYQYTNNFLIYDRYHRYPESEKVKHQKNVGQNVYDIFDFIVTHYDNLPEATIFCRAALMFPKGRQRPLSNGNISEENFKKLVNNTGFTELHDYREEAHAPYIGHAVPASIMDEDGGFLEINNSWYLGAHPARHFSSLNQFLSDLYVNPDLPQYIRFSPGANYIIPKTNILRYSKNFYEQIREILSYDCIIGEAHLLERALYTIFTCNYEVKPKYA